MRAAMEIAQSKDLFPKAGMGETFDQWILRIVPNLAQIIDRETGAAEIAEALKLADALRFAVTNYSFMLGGTQLRQFERVVSPALEAFANVSTAVLARHAGK